MRLIPFKPLVFIPAGTKIKFARHYRFAIIETALLALLTVGLLATMSLNFGIDFRGGTKIEIRMTDGAADIAAIRSKVEALGLGETQIQGFGEPTDVLIRIAEQPGGEKAQQEAVAKVVKSLGEKVELRQVDVVGATVSAELLQGSIIALSIAFMGIFLFVWTRFEWQFSVAALIALFHDVAAVLCILSLLQIDFDLTVVAALLTLIGYAVNDTVVMFDRIRENLRKFKRMPLDELIDLSLNQTLSRTFATASCVLITLVAVYVFGGTAIHNFMFTLLVGTAVSAYTSLFVAAPLLYALGVKRDWSGTATVARGPQPAKKTAEDAALEDAPAETFSAEPEQPVAAPANAVSKLAAAKGSGSGKSAPASARKPGGQRAGAARGKKGGRR